MLSFRVFAKLQPRPERPSALSPRPLVHSRHATPLFPKVSGLYLRNGRTSTSFLSTACGLFPSQWGVYPPPLAFAPAALRSSKSFLCHSYENTRDIYQLFPMWNSRPGVSTQMDRLVPLTSHVPLPNSLKKLFPCGILPPKFPAMVCPMSASVWRIPRFVPVPLAGEKARIGTYSREWSVVGQRGSGSHP